MKHRYGTRTLPLSRTSQQGNEHPQQKKTGVIYLRATEQAVRSWFFRLCVPFALGGWYLSEEDGSGWVGDLITLHTFMREVPPRTDVFVCRSPQCLYM